MATHYSILAWKISWTEEPTVHGVTESDTTEQLNAYLSTCFCKPKENFHFYQNKSHNYSNGELCKKKKTKKQQSGRGTSLVVWSLRLHALNAGGCGLIPDQESDPPSCN